ncbi:unnamed protein product [Dracunculus medinensis]|uniref:Dosage compensation protein dpy-30 n=1 Tax=Dracunculus medinensis TaxID=318479 RepID=A0A3P7SFE1_DRAME|nr:unnamed protein product [Dracunculus medinensis]
MPKATDPPQQTIAESTEASAREKEKEKKEVCEMKKKIFQGEISGDVSSSNTALSTRQYLDQTVVPILLQALGALAKERPPNPIEFVANYLMKEKDRFTVATPTTANTEASH